ncbi:MAG: SMC-Scp complex subunit ScpB [candidate division Zixibacteria bacterium]
MREEKKSGKSIVEPIIEPTESRISDVFENDYSAAVEALIFASPDPLGDMEIARIVKCGKGKVPAIIDELNARYLDSGRAFRIEEFGDKYRFYTLPDFDKYISRLADIPRPARLSKAALEVLSIVAYRQPTAKADIERVRGINPDGVLKTLMEKGLVEICGRSDGPGRPLLFGTTREFLDFFGISDLSELPMPEPVEDEDMVTGLVLKRAPETADPATSTDEN